MKIQEVGQVMNFVVQKPKNIRYSEMLSVSVKEWKFNSNIDRNNVTQKTVSSNIFRKKYDKQNFMSE